MITEQDYTKKTSLAHRKKFAQFFTPEQIATFMTNWLLNGKMGTLNILEPAIGLGIFTRTMLKTNPLINVIGYDIDETIFKCAQSNFNQNRNNVCLCNENYLTSSWSDKYDGIICNPPYLKFHDYDNTSLVPLVNEKLGIHLTGFTNIYSLFLLKSIFQLKEGGKLAYIIPSEFLNSDYGVEVKRVLVQSGVLRHIIVVDFTQCAFDDALTTACILFCEKTSPSDNICFSRIDTISELASSFNDYVAINRKELNPEIKWRQYYEAGNSSKYKSLVPFSTFARVSRGIATGANNYFTFNESKKDAYNIPKDCFLPCICHSIDVQDIIFTSEDFEKLSALDKNLYLFNGSANDTNEYVKNYLELGIENGINKRHLTANRSPWYALENRKPAPIWVSVFNRNGLRFVRNLANAYNLTTFHCIYNISKDIETDILFAYLITDMAKEIFYENSRQYGNGLIKFEPNDLNKGQVVDFRCLSENEMQFIRNAYQNLHYYGTISNQIISLLDSFFRQKYSKRNTVSLTVFIDALRDINANNTLPKYKKNKTTRVKQLNFLSLFSQYGNSPIFEAKTVREDVNKRKYLDGNDTPIKDCLIGLVKADNIEKYISQNAKFYYTGKKFPASFCLKELQYFIPYIKGKGIRDIYTIKIIRLGHRKEGQKTEDTQDIRLVFEIQFERQLFNDYKPAKLDVWRTFSNIQLNDIQLIRP